MKADKNIKMIIKSFVFFVISVLFGFFMKSGLNEYHSVLDKYLNFNCILLIHIFTALNFLMSACFLHLFITVIKRKKESSEKSKTFSNILIVLFVLVNIAAVISVITIQSNENEVVDTIPDSVGSYVDFHTVFEISPNDDYYHEQTVFNKISTEIPMNYNVQQASSDSSVQTSCIEITDDNLLSMYYMEQEEKYSQYNIIPFDDNELTAISADKGFYCTFDDYNLSIVIIKDNKLFDVNMFSENIEMTDVIMKQIAVL